MGEGHTRVGHGSDDVASFINLCHERRATNQFLNEIWKTHLINFRSEKAGNLKSEYLPQPS